MPGKKFTTVEEYISSFPEGTQKLLEQIRAAVKAAAPGAREKISYQIAAFELNGRNLVHYAGWKNHVSVYPIPSGSDAFNREAAQYVDGKGTLKFPLNQPLPLDLIRQVIDLRIAESLKITGKEKG